jgi:hypothetical protein
MAVFTHHLALFTIFGEGIWFLISELKWQKPKLWFSQFKPFIVIGLAYSLWLYPMYYQMSRIKGSGFWLAIPKVKDLTSLLFRFVVGGVPEQWIMITIVLVVVILFGKDWKKVGKQWWGLLLIGLSPVVLSFVVSYIITPVFYDRYLVSVVVMVAVLIGVGTKKQFLPVLGLLVGIYLFISYEIFVHPIKPPFRELATYVKSVKKDEDVLINWNGASHHLWETQYYDIKAPIYTPGGPLPLYVGTAQMAVEDTITKLPKVSGRIGLVASEDPAKIMLPGYKMTMVKEFGKLRFMWWETN